MAGRDKLFNRWLKKTALDSVLQARVLLEQGDEEDKENKEDEESGGEVDNEDIDTDEELAAAEKKDGRGGPQRAAAATREVPPPSPEDLTMEIIVDKLNAIRSGKSLKDQGVRQRIGEYFNDLSSAQRLALFAFLEGLAEVVASEVPGDDARSPSDPDIRVDMEQTESEQDIEEKPGQPRVAKPEAEEYDTDQAKKKMRRRQPVEDVPHTTKDATDDAPIMVVRR